MTRDEVVTALRCCVSVGLDCCKTCLVAQEDGCEDAIKVYAADLIENQQREIEALLQANDALRERQRKRKAVLISIKPKWCKKIVDGEKTIELRKAKPRIPTPFKCYIYCTPEQPDPNIPISQEQLMRDYLDTGSMECLNCPLGNGKVIGEFVCDNVYEIDLAHAIDARIFMESCVGAHEMYEYLNRKTGYGWHISDLKIYEQPKELSEFCAPQDAYCERRRPIAHAPRNWCYVEEG